MPTDSSKHLLDKTESIYYSYECIPICKKDLHTSSLPNISGSILKHYPRAL